MFKKADQIKPLPSGMTDAFTRTLERHGFVTQDVIEESAMSELSADLRSMSDKDFQAQYKMTKAEMRIKLKQKNESVTEAVKEVPPSDLAKSANTVKGSKAHQLGVGLDLKQMVQHAKSNRDIDMDGDVDKLDKGTPDEITGAEKKDQTPKMMAKYAKEKQHTKVGNAFEAVEKKLDPVHPKHTARPLSAHKDQDINNDGKVDSSDQYLHKRRQAITKALKIQEDALHPDAHKVLKHIKPEHQAKYKPDLTKKHYTGNYADRSAVLKAAQNAGHLNEDAELEEGWDDMLKAAKERNKPQPNGAGGKKQGSAYGGSKQKDAPAPKNEELHGDQHKLDKNKNGKLDKHDFKLLKKESVLDEEVKVGDKVSFDHPMTAAPGKTMKKVGTVHKIEGDTVHIKVKDKYGVIAHKKSASELRKEEAPFNPLKHVKNPSTAVKTAAKDVKRGSYADRAALMKAGGVKDDRGPRGVTQEEVEQIDELNRDTVMSYANKSEKDQDNQEKKMNSAIRANNPKAANAAGHKLQKRMAGSDRAEKRLNSEENSDLSEAPQGHTIEAHGVKGMKSTPWRKTFKHEDHLSDWADKNDAEVHGTRDLEKPKFKEEVELDEASNYKLYHTTFSAAVQEAIAVAKKQGYEVDEEDWQNKVATGPKKPSKDKTNSYSIDLTKNGSPTKKKLQIQVYNMGEKYELNTYVG
jgi:hypothetical protein